MKLNELTTPFESCGLRLRTMRQVEHTRYMGMNGIRLKVYG